jgi:hypothetical protein
MDTLDTAGLAHQADPPDLASEVTQSSSDFDMIFIQEFLPCGNILNPVGESHRGKHRQNDLANILRIIEMYPQLEAPLPQNLREELDKR